MRLFCPTTLFIPDDPSANRLGGRRWFPSKTEKLVPAMTCECKPDTEYYIAFRPIFPFGESTLLSRSIVKLPLVDCLKYGGLQLRSPLTSAFLLLKAATDNVIRKTTRNCPDIGF